MARLSLCMIVKDEAEMLGACLASVQGVVDEMIVVDTGSNDDTIAIAHAAGAVVVREPWRNDFAAARNIALAHATGDYVVQLDADERLAMASRPVLKAAVERGGFDLAMLSLHNARRLDARDSDVVSGAQRDGDVQRLPRLFRRTEHMRYAGMIHETVSTSGRVVIIDGIDLIHFGALPEVIHAKNKVERNITMLRAQIAAEPEKVTAYGYLALMLVRLGRGAEAGEVIEVGWSLVAEQPKSVSCRRLAMARAALAYNSGQTDVVVETARVLQRREQLGPDMQHLKGKALEAMAQGKDDKERKQLLTEALAAQSAAIKEGAGVQRERFIEGATSYAALARKGMILLQLGRAREAVAPLSEANRLQPGNREIMAALERALRR